VSILYLIGCIDVVGVLVGMVFECEFPVSLFDIISGGCLRKSQDFVERVARCAAQKEDIPLVPVAALW